MGKADRKECEKGEWDEKNPHSFYHHHYKKNEKSIFIHKGKNVLRNTCQKSMCDFNIKDNKSHFPESQFVDLDPWITS